MAMLYPAEFRKIEKYRNSIHNPTTATYTSFLKDGKTYFQIDTFGSKDRELTEKVSQSIQFDKEMAQKLIDVIRIEFDIE